jgi:NADPH:quinone reductase-like Zn-dependent oxidoreductase
VLVHRDETEDLRTLAGFVRDGRLRPVVSAVYPLEDVAAAVTHFHGGHGRGKVAVAVNDTAWREVQRHA